MKRGILNHSKEELEKILAEYGIEKFRAKQLLVWIYRFGKACFSEMTNIGKELQKQLGEVFYIYRPKIIQTVKSTDGTIKFLLGLSDGCTIECVFIPEEKRNTICVSSQIGCSVGCKFCNTGYHGFIRNLSTEEIISQLLVIKDYLNLWNTEDRLSNVVFMGMGEPLFNHENILKAVYNLILDEKDGISRRKITVSTSGISPILKEIAKDLPCRLAISLHAPNDILRNRIMPINKIYNIASILDACLVYSSYHEYLKITFEYLLLGGINDSKECAHELLILLKGINAKVNLLQFNSWDGCDFVPSTKRNVIQFAKILKDGGIEAPIRNRRGEDIMAACGQLASRNSEIEGS
ncbi:MAG: 23S rRNA (adenine(2503)-C(2))-methyltransferase RlmN [Holosporales bacterium]|jgi:23S rRNA (adenine2503-C2)-methyltransferase|nr:23S rRNA (adenine(2503)-C(2))-methyltransferase RlmN [Holosporales bacterium]